MFNMFSIGFSQILNPTSILYIVLGVVIGIIFGAIPGLTATTAIALCLPLTYTMDTATALSTLVALYIGGVSGGLISAILLNIPGTPSSVATTFDGAPMARNGQAGKALGVGILYSFIGGSLSFVALFFIAPTVARFALNFGYYEYFAICLFAVTLIGSLAGNSIVKGLLSALLGMAFAVVGMAPIDGVTRYTFGLVQFNGGFDILPVLVGLFAISELLQTTKTLSDSQGFTIRDYKVKGFGITMKEFVEQVPNCLLSTLIGLGIGILPGIGGATSNILAYIAAKKTSRHPEQFGTGCVDGIVASETANNATVGGALIPMLTLGIPGDAATSILMGGFILHGLTPGPLLFANNGDIVYAVFAALIIANFVMLVVEFFGIKGFVQLLRVPQYILMPIIMALCVVGAYCLNHRVFDIWAVLLFGVVGYVMRCQNVPLPPFILGFILCETIETNFRRGYMLGGGDLFAFVSTPLSAMFILFTVISVGFTIVHQVRKSKAKTVETEAS